MAWPKGKPRSAETRAKLSRPRQTLEERFWSKVDKRGPDACWHWLGALISDTGYGKIGYGGHQQTEPAHRIAWLLAHGEMPDGVVDHVCHNRDPDCPGGACAHRRCVNPAHLRVVPQRVNLRSSRLTQPTLNAAKTCCKNGHPFNALNTYIRPDGYRDCRVCRAAAEARRRRKAKETK